MRLNVNEPFQKAHPVSFPYLTDLGYDKNIASVTSWTITPCASRSRRRTSCSCANVAMEFASIVSAEYAAQLLKSGKVEDFNQKPVGTGAFVFRDYQKALTIRYDANSTFWNRKDVHIDELVLPINARSRLSPGRPILRAPRRSRISRCCRAWASTLGGGYPLYERTERGEMIARVRRAAFGDGLRLVGHGGAFYRCERPVGTGRRRPTPLFYPLTLILIIRVIRIRIDTAGGNSWLFAVW
ncbi:MULTISPECIES: ABC transporter substrate-binding protein [unclassified Caballeronia]|uniref:ABC transporter substrate-binding protein n=1 Tax=unclassified Caballeronia TaxID=2646786 RepID=UPI002029B254|nr:MULTISPECIES: ABC transporter substrate-binding protein [unclassified Caballeronia]